jgi:hypothetical protein
MGEYERQNMRKICQIPAVFLLRKKEGFPGPPEKTKPFYPKMRGLQRKYLSSRVKTDLHMLEKLTAIILEQE